MSTQIEKANQCQVAPQDNSAEATVRYTKPYFETFADEQGYRVQVHVPGFGKEEVEIEVADGIAKIKTAVSKSAEASWKPLVREWKVEAYALDLKIPTEVDEQKIEASVNNGLLQLVLPKKEAHKSRKITVA